MLIKKETSTVVKIELNEIEKSSLKNYSGNSIDHCTIKLAEGVYFVFCKANSEGLIKFNGKFLFIGELESAIRQEQNYHNDSIVIKYCCDNSCKIGRVLSNNCLIQPMFNNNKIGYEYVNSNLYCYNVA